MIERDTLRIAAVADIHVKKSGQGTLQPLAMPVLAAAFPDCPPFRVVEVPLTAEAVA